jgi:uncharacterized membrane protein
MLFFYVLLIVGAVAGYLYGVDTALLAGKRAVEIWILVGLLLVLLNPFFDIFRLIRAVINIFRKRA